MKTLFFNGVIKTLDKSGLIAEAIIINKNKIVEIGKTADLIKNIKQTDTKIDLKGRMMLPGFVDTHTHFYEVALREIMIDLTSVSTIESFRKRLLEYRKQMSPEIEWISGSGWEKDDFSNCKSFNKTLLDEVFPDIPVSLSSKDLHTKLCNSKALQLAGITRDTLSPQGGEIGRFSNGEPDGFLYEKAWVFINKVEPQINYKLKKRIVKQLISDSFKNGLTAVHVMENSDAANLYQEIVKEDHNFRFFWHFPSNDLDEIIAQNIKSYTGSKFFFYCGMKIFMDGSVGSQTAFMSTPYPDDKSNFGSLSMNPEQLTNLMIKATNNAISSSIHAIGDKCIEIVIDVIENVNKITGTKLPHRIEHLQCINPTDILRLKKLNIFCAVQPIHIQGDVEITKKYWPKHEKKVYSLRTLLDNKINLCFGSDAPVETMNPFCGIYSAIQRKFRNNPQNESWLPEQKISIDEAIEGYTIKAAESVFLDKNFGSIEINKIADLIVIDDYRKEKDEFWLDAQSLMTIVDGKIVYTSEKF